MVKTNTHRIAAVHHYMAETYLREHVAGDTVDRYLKAFEGYQIACSCNLGIANAYRILEGISDEMLNGYISHGALEACEIMLCGELS